MYVYSQLVQSRAKVIFVPDYTCFILCLHVCMLSSVHQRIHNLLFINFNTVFVILVFLLSLMHTHYDIIMTVEFDNDIQISRNVT